MTGGDEDVFSMSEVQSSKACSSSHLIRDKEEVVHHQEEFETCQDCNSTGLPVHIQDANNIVTIDPNAGISYTGEKPYEGQEFQTHEDVYNYYNSYAKKAGFGIRKEAGIRSRIHGEYINRTFVCSKAGIKRPHNRDYGRLVNHRPDTRVGCSAFMRIKLTHSNTWVVTKLVVEHKNHELSSPDKVLKYNSHRQRHRMKINRDLMAELREEGMGPTTISKVLNVLNASRDGHSREENITTQQVTDYIRTIRENNIGTECISIIRHFQDKRESDPDFYFSMEVDQFGTMRSVFWADGRARSSYLSFGDVVVFDVTYKTNHLCLPFAPFTGVNHHRQSILLGCALLADEQEETFIWLFKQWLKCMHGLAPKAIITDQDIGMGNAIRIVFPNVRHRYCSWHIRKHIAEQQLLLRTKYGDDFFTYFDSWYNASTVGKCENLWKDLRDKFDIDENADNWLSKMYRNREHWVDAYLKDTFWAGMTTTQRSESINSFFDGYVNSRTKLMEFVSQYDKAVASRRAAELEEDFMTLNTMVPTYNAHPLEEQAREAYTRGMWKLFQKELMVGMSLFREELLLDGSKETFIVGCFTDKRENWEEVVYDKTNELEVKCTCAMFETDGILCRHILNVMWHNQVACFPDKYILHRWKISAWHRNVRSANTLNLSTNDHDNINRCRILRRLAIRTKLNSTLEMTEDSDDYLSHVENVIENLYVGAEKEFRSKSKINNGQHSNFRSQATSSAHVLLRDGRKILVKDPSGPAKTKGRPKTADRIKFRIEESQEKKEIKKHKCGNCQEYGHYKTGCPKLKK